MRRRIDSPPVRFGLLLAIVLAFASLLSMAPAKAADPAGSAAPDGLAFFEQKIRPVLVQQCYECHSAESKALKGGLLVDSKAGLLSGGDSGPSIVPGNADESLLLAAIKYDGLEMPPKGKLPPQVIADFERWIKMGAPDPRSGKAVVKGKIDIEAGRQFWAYQLPKQVAPPQVNNSQWPIDDIDHFILAKIEAAGLTPSVDADRRTLIRRLSYDLIGLPPTQEEVEAFANDKSPDAYERLVDRLLESPHFGERWARHWLDVARFAESLTLRGFVLKDAWRYRDYVIDSFNEDRPFDQFVREQVAGDLLTGASLDERRRQMIATSFLALGNTNLEEQDKKQLAMDIVDEQLDVIGRGLLAQTITCARCHDHKFDPISARDYYAMAGILRSTKTVEHSNVSKWLELPLPAEPEMEKAYAAQATELASIQSQMKLMKAALANQTAVASTTGTDTPPKITALADLKGIIVDDVKATKVGNWKPSQVVKRFVGDGYIHDDNKDKGEKTLTFIPTLPSDGTYEVRLAYIPGSGRANKVPVTVFSAEGELELNVDQTDAPPIDGRWVSLGAYKFERVGQSYVIVSNEGTMGVVTADAVQFLPVTKTEAVATAAAQDKPKDKDDDKPDPKQLELKRLEARAKEIAAETAKRPTLVGVTEEKQIADTAIHIRGNVHNLGESVPRGFMQVALYGPAPKLSTLESGRRELGDWLASRDNPLTARVFANRVWMWLFGEGLVRTVDNFGTTGELPSHPELLDHLALQFMEQGWSTKKLIRTIVMSRAYQLSSRQDIAAKARAKDPDNRLWARAERRRMDAESLRDTVLWISGSLDLTRGGPTFAMSATTGATDRMTGLSSDYNYQHKDLRRSVYSSAFRNSPVELFEVFDVADPSTVTGRRNESTVAPQALYLMNHPFIIAQAERTATRLLNEQQVDDRARVERAYRLILGRSPTERESTIALKFVSVSKDDDPDARLRPWSQFVQSLFCSIDFRYLD